MYTIKHFLIYVISCFEASQHSYQLTLWREILVWSKICFFIGSCGKMETGFTPSHTFIPAHCTAVQKLPPHLLSPELKLRISLRFLSTKCVTNYNYILAVIKRFSTNLLGIYKVSIVTKMYFLWKQEKL